MTEKQVKEMIEQGESSTVEFKSWTRTPNIKELINLIVKEAVGFANAKGGTILLGVEDDGKITGCPDHDIQNLIERIYDRTVPQLFTEIEVIQTVHGTIFAITVPVGNQIYAVASGEIYKRLGKNTKPYYPNTLASDTKPLIDYSSKVIENSSEIDIDKLEVYKIKEKIRMRDMQSTLYEMEDIPFLIDMGLAVLHDGKLKLTVAGLLFVGKKESLNRLLPQAEVIYLHYSDQNREEYDNRIDMKLPVVTIIESITEKIRGYNKLTNVQIGLFRLEVYDFSEKVFQEALLNAISHRDYQSNGAIYVKHYSDCIIIENPGSFPEGITERNIITHPSKPRNKLIAETLQRLKYVQRSGQGVDIMFRETVQMGKPYPEYSTYDEAVKLTIYSNLENMQFVRMVSDEQNERGLLALSELMILRYLSENRWVKLSKARELTQASEAEVRRSLNNLISRGLIQLSGREYMLTEKVYSMIKSDVSYPQDKIIQYVKAKEMICDYISRSKSITNKKVQELCGYSRNRAHYTLKKLCDESVLKLVGKGSGAKYVLAE